MQNACREQFTCTCTCRCPAFENEGSITCNSLFQICSTRCGSVVVAQEALPRHTPPPVPSSFPQLHRPPNPLAAPSDPRETTTCPAKRTLALAFATDTGRSYCQSSNDRWRPGRPWACGSGSLERAEPEESHDHRRNGASSSKLTQTNVGWRKM